MSIKDFKRARNYMGIIEVKGISATVIAIKIKTQGDDLHYSFRFDVGPIHVLGSTSGGVANIIPTNLHLQLKKPPQQQQNENSPHTPLSTELGWHFRSCS